MQFNFRRLAATLTVLGAATLVPAAAFADGRVAWSGQVDDTAIVYIHGQNAQTRTVSGHSVNNANTQFLGRLPRRPVFVSLGRYEGRGRVRVVQQPRPGNGFTAAVRIHDPQSGSGFYRFVLNW